MKFNIRENYHAIAGIPRGWSTVLTGILSENPALYPTDTAVDAHIMATLQEAVSAPGEIKRDIFNDPQAEERLKDANRAWLHIYHGKQNKIIMAKARGWMFNAALFHTLFPKGQIFVNVRCLRNCFASMIEKDRQTGLFSNVGIMGPIKLLTHQADFVFRRHERDNPNAGFLGQFAEGVENLIRIELPFVHFIKADSLSENPKQTMDTIHQKLYMKPFNYDFENIPKTKDEGFYDLLLNKKFPHEVSGKLGKEDPNKWKKFFDKEVGQWITDQFPLYNKTFGYGEVTKKEQKS